MAPNDAPSPAAGSKMGSKPDPNEALKTLSVPEMQAKAGIVTRWSHASRSGKATHTYGLNEIEEKKTKRGPEVPQLFWGPIPWMIEVAVILSAAARHWPDFGIILPAACGQRGGRVLGRTSGG